MIQNIRLEDGRFIYVNPSWIKILGYQKEELQNLNFKDIIHPDSLKHCLNIFREAANGNDVLYLKLLLFLKMERKFLFKALTVAYGKTENHFPQEEFLEI